MRLHFATVCAPAALTVGLLSACAVGPDYRGPPGVAASAMARSSFRRSDVAPVVPTPPPARWWEAVNDPLLTRLIDEAFVASPTLKSLVAQVRSARAQLLANQTNLLPTGGASARYIRARVPTGSLVPNATGTSSGSGASTLPDPLKIAQYSVGANATWDLDIFGGTRRSIEGAGATVSARQAAFEDAQVVLASDMAKAYVVLREAQHRVVLALSMIDLRERSIELTRQRRERGTASEVELQQLISQAEQDRAALPALLLTVEQQLDQIAILVAREPGAMDSLLVVTDGQPVFQPLPPDAVPVGEPSMWLQRRPDVREAERILAASNAAIGQQVAAYFPAVSLLGFISTSGPQPSKLFRGAPITLLMPSLSWSFLNIAHTRALVRGAEADRDQALADYESKVLVALQDANDSLSSYGRKRSALLSQQAALTAAEKTERLTRQRFGRGTASLVDAYDAERERISSDDRSAQARSEFMQSYIALQKSLGLGWGAPEPVRVGAVGAVNLSESPKQ